MEFAQLNDSSCKTYFVGCPDTQAAALIDPVIGLVDDYLERFTHGGWQLRLVIDTHTHADHISGGRLLMERTGADYVMHNKAGSQRAKRNLSDGATVEVGNVTIEAIETPGHTKDSVSLLLPGKILTGDWLFIGAAGRTDLPGGDPGEHWDSLQKVIPTLDDDTVVFPGHDYQNHSESPMRQERRRNVNLQPPRSREAYAQWLAGASLPTPEWMIETVRANNDGVLDSSVSFMPEGAESACMCQPSTDAGTLATISVTDVYALPADDASERLLLDVREPTEYGGSLGHVPGARLVPLGQLPSRLDEISEFRDKTVIAICKSGGRSARACGILKEAGFGNVLNMTGGTLAWNENGFPVER